MGTESKADVERRFVPLPEARVEIRAPGDGAKKGIGGVAAVFNTETDLGWFTEEIAPGAFENVLTNDVRGLFNHNPDFVLGRTKAGTMALAESDAGLEYSIPDMPKSRADVLEAVERGDVSGNSFAFTIGEQTWIEDDPARSKPHRIIKRVAQLWDVGPVVYPAYEETVVSARSLDQVRALLEASDRYAADAEQVRALIESLPGAKEVIATARGFIVVPAELRVVPKNVSTDLAPRDQAWSKPRLQDFEPDTAWGDLTDARKREIAGYFAWADQMPPDTFDSLRLGHHDPATGKVVFKGLAAAAGRLDQTNIPDAGKEQVRAHLGAHYRAFDETPPWERAAEAEAEERAARIAVERERLALEGS